jgi:hypothetical protein
MSTDPTTPRSKLAGAAKLNPGWVFGYVWVVCGTGTAPMTLRSTPAGAPNFKVVGFFECVGAVSRVGSWGGSVMAPTTLGSNLAGAAKLNRVFFWYVRRVCGTSTDPKAPRSNPAGTAKMSCAFLWYVIKCAAHVRTLRLWRQSCQT